MPRIQANAVHAVPKKIFLRFQTRGSEGGPRARNDTVGTRAGDGSFAPRKIRSCAGAKVRVKSGDESVVSSPEEACRQSSQPRSGSRLAERCSSSCAANHDCPQNRTNAKRSCPKLCLSKLLENLARIKITRDYSKLRFIHDKSPSDK